MQYIIILLIVIGLVAAHCAEKMLSDTVYTCAIARRGTAENKVVKYNMELKEEYQSISNKIIGGE